MDHERTPADTGVHVARMAADYHNVTIEELERMLREDPDRLLQNIRSMAGSLRRQNERP